MTRKRDYADNRRYALRKARSLCVDCSNEAHGARIYCLSCLEAGRIRAERKRSRERAKAQAANPRLQELIDAFVEAVAILKGDRRTLKECQISKRKDGAQRGAK